MIYHEIAKKSSYCQTFFHFLFIDVTASANINRTTFYRHYLDKYDWLGKYIDLHLQDVDVICRELHFTQAPFALMENISRLMQHFIIVLEPSVTIPV